MCHKIESNFVLIHHLRNNNSCTITELVHIKRNIEEKTPNVFVDVSKSSLMDSVSSFPKIFTWIDNKIVKSENSNVYFKEPLIDYFDSGLRNDIKEEITSLLEVAS